MSSPDGPSPAAGQPDAWLVSGQDQVTAAPCNFAAPGRAVVDGPSDLLQHPPGDLEIVVLQPAGEPLRLPVLQIGIVRVLTADPQRTLAVLGFEPDPDVPDGEVLEKVLGRVLNGRSLPEAGDGAGSGPRPQPPAEITDLQPPVDRGTPIPVRHFRPSPNEFGICSILWWLCD